MDEGLGRERHPARQIVFLKPPGSNGRGAVVEPARFRLLLEGETDAEHALARFPLGKQGGGAWVVEGDAPHDGEPVGIFTGSFQGQVVAPAFPSRRYQNRSRDARGFHLLQQLVIGY